MSRHVTTSMRAAFGAWLALCLAPAAGPGLAAAAERLTLADAVHRAGHQAADVVIANLGVEASDARTSAARAALLPNLSAAASQSQRTFNLNAFGIPFPSEGVGPLIGPVGSFDARVRVTQTIADLSEWRHIRSAGARGEASRADANTRAQDAAEDAALCYAAAERARATLEARGSDLALAAELDSLARVQLSAGTAANIDVLRAATQLATARGEVVVARNAYERARIALARSMGAGVAAPFELADSLGMPVSSDAPASREEAIAMALRRRSELPGERARLAAARTEKSAIASERIPRLDAAADYGANGLHLDDAIATRQVALQLSWPLFDGTRREARIREQAALIGESETRVRDFADRVEAEVEAALLDLESGREQEGIAREREALALEQLHEARVRFQNGAANNIEVIDAQSAVVRARDAAIAAMATTATASIHLARATGATETLRTP